MKQSLIFLLLISSLAAVSCSTSQTQLSQPSSAATPGTYKKISAKEAVRLADPEAKKWKNDAVVHSVSQRGTIQEFDFSPDGKGTWDFADVKTGASSRWVVEYFVPKTREVYVVDVFDGKIHDSSPEGRFDATSKPGQLTVNWIDSTDALKIARQEIEMNLKSKQDDYMAVSKLKYLVQDAPYWAIEFYESNGNKPLYGVVINAINGKIIESERP
jgi:hypothetical protein